jgi:hypothetical protein
VDAPFLLALDKIEPQRHGHPSSSGLVFLSSQRGSRASARSHAACRVNRSITSAVRTVDHSPLGILMRNFFSRSSAIAVASSEGQRQVCNQPLFVPDRGTSRSQCYQYSEHLLFNLRYAGSDFPGTKSDAGCEIAKLILLISWWWRGND